MWAGVRNGVDIGAIPGKGGSEPALQEVVEKALVQEFRDLSSSPSNATQSLTGLGQDTLLLCS